MIFGGVICSAATYDRAADAISLGRTIPWALEAPTVSLDQMTEISLNFL